MADPYLQNPAPELTARLLAPSSHAAGCAFCCGRLPALVLFVLLAGGRWRAVASFGHQSRAAVLDGDLHLAGLSAPVTVRRDAHGVPHIEAATQEDLFVAQGYVTAQDRLWQMDAFRRNANGELAEIMGPSLVKHDTAQRVLQFRNTARRVYANLTPLTAPGSTPTRAA